ncbi:MAG TPA: ATP-dependent DNA ligase [Nitrospiraceae bacterium]|nr:ATP-dependent DNA ligase [Nitrospiraceae bacterium]
MLFFEIVRTSQQVTQTQGRLEKIGRLSACLRNLSPDEIDIGVHILAGQLRQGTIGIGSSALHTAAPDTAAAEPSLTLKQVDQAIEALASTRGSGSGAERRRLLGALLSQGTPDEQHFLKRLIVGELRQGALEGIMAEAVARAADVPIAVIRRALMLAGDLAKVTTLALTEGIAGLSRLALHVLQPIHPMLAQPADDVADALSYLHEAAFEYKMDGARVQVHKLGQDIRVFTRTLNDVTASVPEIVEAARNFPVRSIVLDGEVLAFRPDGLPYPFQMTMRRFGRKLDVHQMRDSLPLTPFFFDCLHLDGEDLIDRTSTDRVAAMQNILPSPFMTPRLVTPDQTTAETFLQNALSHGHEGVMAKALGAAYEAGRRGRAWLKIKRAHTLDLLVLAAEWGNGRRQGWLSNLHLGARDPVNGGFVMLGKTFKGMTDDMLKWQTDTFKELQIASDGYTVYIRPEVVVEIAFNDIQASPHYPGGLALRFGRVKRYRPDKTPEQVDTIETVRAIHARAAGSEQCSDPPLDRGPRLEDSP